MKPKQDGLAKKPEAEGAGDKPTKPHTPLSATFFVPCVEEKLLMEEKIRLTELTKEFITFVNHLTLGGNWIAYLVNFSTRLAVDGKNMDDILDEILIDLSKRFGYENIGIKAIAGFIRRSPYCKLEKYQVHLASISDAPPSRPSSGGPPSRRVSALPGDLRTFVAGAVADTVDKAVQQRDDRRRED